MGVHNLTSRRTQKRLPQTDRLIPGFHALEEGLRQKQNPIQEIWVAEGKKSERISRIIRTASAKNIPIHFKQTTEITELLSNKNHQGIIGVIRRFEYADFQAIKRQSLKSGPSALLLAADHITDSGNLGALIRTAAFFGTHGLMIPKDRSAGITGAVFKRASGTHFQLPIAKVTNLGRTLDELAKVGFWIIGAAGEASTVHYEFDWKRPVVLVLGSEQRGLSQSVRKRCHEVVRIPSPGGVESLNISVAGGVILSEICRQRQR